jgi:hypothetical protein
MTIDLSLTAHVSPSLRYLRKARLNWFDRWLWYGSLGISRLKLSGFDEEHVKALETDKPLFKKKEPIHCFRMLCKVLLFQVNERGLRVFPIELLVPQKNVPLFESIQIFDVDCQCPGT